MVNANKLPVWPWIIIQKLHSAMNVLISPEMPSPALPSFILRQAAGVQVGVLWDKQHSTHIKIVRKSTLRLWKMLSLMSIKTILNKIQLFKNLKLEREMYVLDCRTHPLDVHKLFPLVINIILEFFEWLYLVQYRPAKRQTWECC